MSETTSLGDHSCADLDRLDLLSSARDMRVAASSASSHSSPSLRSSAARCSFSSSRSSRRLLPKAARFTFWMLSASDASGSSGSACFLLPRPPLALAGGGGGGGGGAAAASPAAVSPSAAAVNCTLPSEPGARSPSTKAHSAASREGARASSGPMNVSMITATLSAHDLTASRVARSGR